MLKLVLIERNLAVNPFMPKGIFYLHSSDRSIFNIRGIWAVLLISYFIEIPVFNANNVDADQTPRSAVSDLGLHCLPIPLLWDARLKWVTNVFDQRMILHLISETLQ